MNPLDRIVQKINLATETGNAEFLKEAKAIADCLANQHYKPKVEPIKFPNGFKI